jgi:hypothetical protein
MSASLPPSGAVPEPPPLPLGLRVAATLCAVVSVVSVVSVLGALALGVPALEIGGAAAALSLAVNLAASFAVGAAAVLAWRRRRASVVLVGLAWLLPIATSLLLGTGLRLGGYLLLLATLTLAVHWNQMR